MNGPTVIRTHIGGTGSKPKGRPRFFDAEKLQHQAVNQTPGSTTPEDVEYSMQALIKKIRVLQPKLSEDELTTIIKALVTSPDKDFQDLKEATEKVMKTLEVSMEVSTTKPTKTSTS